jgi:hypothetical protein
MTSLPRPDNRLYFGRGGSGKSTLSREHARDFPRVLLVLPDDSERAPARYKATRDPAELIKAMMQPTFRLAFICDHDPKLWEWCNEAAFRAGDTLIIWEDAGVWMDGRRLRSVGKWAHELWMRGRHQRCRVFACAWRASSVSRDCTANLSRALIFHSTEPADLKFYRAMIDPAAALAVGGLKFKTHEAVDWTDSGWSVKRAPFP